MVGASFLTRASRLMWMSPLSLCKNSKVKQASENRSFLQFNKKKKKTKRKLHCFVMIFAGYRREKILAFFLFLFEVWVVLWDMDMDERTCMRAVHFMLLFSPLFF